jgi:hypothetical protein
MKVSLSYGGVPVLFDGGVLPSGPDRSVPGSAGAPAAISGVVPVALSAGLVAEGGLVVVVGEPLSSLAGPDSVLVFTGVEAALPLAVVLIVGVGGVGEGTGTFLASSTIPKKSLAPLVCKYAVIRLYPVPKEFKEFITLVRTG